MKKIILLFFTLSLMSFGSPKYDFRFKNVDILQVKISRKYNGVRSLTGVVTNKSSKEIEYIKFNIKIKDKNITQDNNYFTVGEIRSYNLPPNKKINFKTYLKVLDMDSRDLKVEIIDLVMSKK
ncbi:hypothetical protein [Psychrilyobacter atlanticus]|uniref:hypothetical protein n=1 Tax=Psychrilyobacter atlanticus TaxID=271091 RepID=UPI000404F00D|nr:hypothetical protein [Psychrilyobacter atlanticus]